MRRTGWSARRTVRGAALAICAAAAFHPARAPAETIESALVKAYQNNPQLNAQRANVRLIDEGVPQALSGYRPRVAITGTVGEQFVDATAKVVSGSQNPVKCPKTNERSRPDGFAAVSHRLNKAYGEVS